MTISYGNFAEAVCRKIGGLESQGAKTRIYWSGGYLTGTVDGSVSAGVVSASNSSGPQPPSDAPTAISMKKDASGSDMMIEDTSPGITDYSNGVYVYWTITFTNGNP